MNVPVSDRLHPDALDAAVLAYVLARHPGPVHRDDLAHAFAGQDWRSSLSALQADGVLHREGELQLASAAAVRVSQLLA